MLVAAAAVTARHSKEVATHPRRQLSEQLDATAEKVESQQDRLNVSRCRPMPKGVGGAVGNAGLRE